jgi:hypothetical protein
MNKKVVVLAILAAIGGAAFAVLRSPERKTAQAEDLFPPEKLAGYAQGAQIKVLKSKGRTAGLGGAGATKAIVIVPYGIEPAQVASTGWWVLKALHKEYPDADWLAAFLAEDSAMASASNWVGIAEFHKGSVTVTGGLPTREQLDSLGKLGEPTRRPSPQDLKVAAAVFDSSGAIVNARWDLSQTLLGAGRSGAIDRSRFFDLDFETTTLHAVAKTLGKPPKEVQATVRAVCRYYWLRAGEPL